VTAAEGVESPEQLAGVRALGCDLAQGFHFSEAIPSETMDTLLQSSPRW
jgi:EAL domain-containing protein (putative c-di-GMP-specific phosphodiesterase class I)